MGKAGTLQGSQADNAGIPTHVWDGELISQWCHYSELWDWREHGRCQVSALWDWAPAWESGTRECPEGRRRPGVPGAPFLGEVSLGESSLLQ